MDEIEVVEEGNTREELLRKFLDVGAGERDKAIGLEEIKDTLPVEVSDNANVVPEVEAVSQVDASVHVMLVVGCECGEDPQLNATSISIFWYRSDDLDGALSAFSLVVGLNDFAERALAEEFLDLVSLCEIGIRHYDVVAVLIVHLLVLGVGFIWDDLHVYVLRFDHWVWWRLVQTEGVVIVVELSSLGLLGLVLGYCPCALSLLADSAVVERRDVMPVTCL